MPKFIGKIGTTDADGIVGYGTNIAMSETDKTPISKKIPHVYYSFIGGSKSSLAVSSTDSVGVSYTTIPENTIVYITSEKNAYIRLPSLGALPLWEKLSSTESKIFLNIEDAEAYASGNNSKVGELITVVDYNDDEIYVYKIGINKQLIDVATSFLIQLYAVDDKMSYTVAAGQSVKFSFTYNELYGDKTTNKSGSIKYQIKRPTDSSFVTIQNPNLITTINCTTTEDKNDPLNYHPVEFDPADFGYSFGIGDNIVQITVTGGESKKSKSIQFTVNVVDMYVTLRTAPSRSVNGQISIGWICYGAGITKTVFIKITDNKTGITKFVSDAGIDVTTSGDTMWTSVNLKDLFGKTEYECHGTYTIEQYCLMKEAPDIRSDSIFYNAIVCYPNNYEPLISAICNTTIMNYGDQVAIPYSVFTYTTSADYINIVEESIFYYLPIAATKVTVVSNDVDPTETQVKISDVNISGIDVGDTVWKYTEDDTTTYITDVYEVVDDSMTPEDDQICISDTKLDVSEGSLVHKVIYQNNVIEFKNTDSEKSWIIAEYPVPEITKYIHIGIECTNTNVDPSITAKRIFVIEISSSTDNTDYDLLKEPDIPVICHLTAANRTNSDTNKSIWRSDTFAGNAVINATLSEFNYVNNGWVKDSSGASCLRLSGSAKCTIPINLSDTYSYYENDTVNIVTSGTIREKGRTFIIDLNIHNVIDYSAECVSWFSANTGRGFKVTPQSAFYTNQIYKLIYRGDAVQNKDSIPFCQIKDDERIQIAFVIEYENATKGYNADTQETKEAQYIRMYLNGVLFKALSFNSDNYDFNNEMVPLTIGSTGAITDVYSIRLYEQALSDIEILKYFISDRPTIKDKIENARVNSIYKATSNSTSGIAIDYDTASQLYPTFLITGQLSPVKGSKTYVGIHFTKPNDHDNDILCMDYYTKEGENTNGSPTKFYLCETNVQGTSSQIYAKKNYKFKFTNLDNAEYGNKYIYYYNDGSNSIYCDFIEFTFSGDYRPGYNEEYWSYLGESNQIDSYDVTALYNKGDKVIYNKKSYECVQNCNFKGADLGNGKYIFVPYIYRDTTSYIVCDNSAVDEQGAYNYYYIPAGDEFYYNSINDEKLTSHAISNTNLTEDKIPIAINKTQMLVSNNDGSKCVHIGRNDEVVTKKKKYTIYPDGSYRGKAESTICVKADYMSPDGINSDNGRMFPSLFDEPVPPAIDDPDIMIAIPGFRCLIFRRDYEGAEIEFFGRYNFNYDKGSVKSFGLENDDDEDEIGIKSTTKCQKWEYLDNKEDICNFKSYKFYQPVNGELAVLSSLESTYPDQGDLEDVGRTPDYLPMQVMYSWVLQRANFWTASTVQVANPFIYNGQYYYTEREYRKAIFLNEFEKHFNKHHVIRYFLCIELIALVDNLAKNMFITCYDVYHDTNKRAALKAADNTLSSVELDNLSKVNIIFTSSTVATVNDIIDKTTGEVNYELIDWENSTFPIFYTSLYDMDSCGGADNSGRNIYNYDIEVTEIYSYDSDGNPIYCFNGATSYFWNMVLEAFGGDEPSIKLKRSEFQKSYAELRSGTTPKLSYNTLLKEYMTNGAETMPPVVYNEDQRFKYLDILTKGYIDINTNSYFYTSLYEYLCQGSKVYHKKWFLQNRLSFLDSKYIIDAYEADASSLTFRVNMGANLSVSREDVAVDITTATTQYQYVSYGNSTSLPGGKCKAGETIHIIPDQGGVYQDIVLTIHGIYNISDIGDISRLYPGDPFNLGPCSKLRRLKIGSSAPGYRNTMLTKLALNNAISLQVLDVSNCANLSTVLDVSYCNLIQEVYASGSSVPAINFPNGGSLKIIAYPNTITSINLKNQQYIELITIDGYDNITEINIENSGGKGLNIPNIIEKCDNLKIARCVGVNWNLKDKNILNKLMSCKGKNAQGTETSKSVLTGVVHVESATSVNVELWNEYWADYISDGRLTIVVDSNPDFYYVSYNNWELVNTAEDIKSIMKSENSSGYQWYCAIEGCTHSQHDSKCISVGNNYKPVLCANGIIIKENGNEVSPQHEARIKDNTIQKYWAVDGKITTYSPDNGIHLSLYDQEKDRLMTYADLTGDHANLNDTSPVEFSRIGTNDTWHINGVEGIGYFEYYYKAVLMDNNGNIVHSTNTGYSYNENAGSDMKNINWVEHGSNGLTVQLNGFTVYDKDTNPNGYKAQLVKYVELVSDFVDIGEKAQYRLSEYPTYSNFMRFSNWSPSEYDIQENRLLFAKYIEGSTEVLDSNFLKFEAYEKDISNDSVISYRLTEINVDAVDTWLGAKTDNNGNSYSTSNPGPIVIPATYQDRPVKVIGTVGKTEFSAFSRRPTAGSTCIGQIYFESGTKLERIENYAFSVGNGNISSLTRIEIPESVKEIGEYAFQNVIGSVIWTGTPIIENLTKNSFAYYGNTSTEMQVSSLDTTQNIPKSIKNIESFAFQYSKVSIHGAKSNIETIDDNAFQYSNGSEYVFSNTLKHIGSKAFMASTTITSISIPASVEFIGDNAFDGCANLASINIESGSVLKHIGIGSTILNGTNYSSNSSNWDGDFLYIKDGGNKYYLLCGRNTATSLNVKTDTRLIAKQAFFNSSLTTLTFDGDANTEYINESAFEQCASLAGSVELPTNVIEIGDNAFKGCAKINSIDVGTCVMSIGKNAFKGCSSATSLLMNSIALTSIDDYAFAEMSSLQKIDIPSSVKYIGDFLLNKSNGLTEISVPYVGRTIESKNTYDSVFGYLFGYQINPHKIKLGDNLSGKSIYIDISLLKDSSFFTTEGNRTLFKSESASSADGESSVNVNAYVTIDSVVVEYIDPVVGIKTATFNTNNTLETNRIQFPVSDYTVTEINEDNVFVYNYDYTSLKCEEGNIVPTEQIFNSETGEYEEYYIPESLKTVNITNAKLIPDGSFYNCINIESININDNITEIGDYGFYNCKNLLSINGNDSLVNLTNLLSIGNYAFAKCEKLTKITCPTITTYIGDSTFSQCSTLANIILPSNCEYIGSDCFDGSDMISYNIINNINYLPSNSETYFIAINASVTNSASYEIKDNCAIIYDNCFNGCSNMTSIKIPASVKIIKDDVFYGCIGLASIEVDTSSDKFKSVNNAILTSHDGTELIFFAPSYSYASEIVLSDVTKIKSHSCIGVANASFNFESRITEVANNAFYDQKLPDRYCTGLRNITFAENIDEVSDKMFYGCSNASIVFTSDINKLGVASFYNCAALSCPTLSQTITEIPDNCFYGCTNLIVNKDYQMPNSLVRIGKNAFNGVTGRYINTIDRMTTIVFEMSENTKITSIGPQAFKGLNTSIFNIPKTVTSIGSQAFMDSGLVSIEIQDKVTTIGSSAFEASNNLKSVTIGQSVTQIAEKAFYACKSLETVKINNPVPTAIALMDENAFVYNDTGRIFVVPNGSYDAYADDTQTHNWHLYYTVIVDEDDFNNGISEFVITLPASASINPSLTIIKDKSLKTTILGDGSVVEKYVNDVSTILWGDRIFFGPGNICDHLHPDDIYWAEGENIGDDIKYVKVGPMTPDALKIIESGEPTSTEILLSSIPNSDIERYSNTVGLTVGDYVLPITTTVNYTYVYDYDYVYDYNIGYKEGDSVIANGIKFTRTYKSYYTDNTRKYFVDELYEPSMTWHEISSGESVAYKASSSHAQNYYNATSSTTGVKGNCSNIIRRVTNSQGAISTTYFSKSNYMIGDSYTYKIKLINRGKWEFKGAAGTVLPFREYIDRVTISNNIKSLNTTQLFRMCKFTEDNPVTLPIGDHDTLGNSFFQQSDIRHIDIPSNIKYIGERAFWQCYNLTEFDFSNIERIGAYSFRQTNISKIILNKIKYLGNKCFGKDSSCIPIDFIKIDTDEIPEMELSGNTGILE